jgi:hypothetical protein
MKLHQFRDIHGHCAVLSLVVILRESHLLFNCFHWVCLCCIFNSAEGVVPVHKLHNRPRSEQLVDSDRNAHDPHRLEQDHSTPRSQHELA